MHACVHVHVAEDQITSPDSLFQCYNNVEQQLAMILFCFCLFIFIMQLSLKSYSSLDCSIMNYIK